VNRAITRSILPTLHQLDLATATPLDLGSSTPCFLLTGGSADFVLMLGSSTYELALELGIVQRWN